MANIPKYFYFRVNQTKEGIELEDASDADFVEVVRCKDCRWYKTNYMWNGTEVKICAKEAYEPVRKEDDFCSHGERK